MLDKTRPSTVVAVTLALFCAALVIGALRFSAGVFQSAFAQPTPESIASWPPAKQTVWARAFPTVDPNAAVAPPAGLTPTFPTLAPPPTGIPPNIPHRAAGAGVIVEESRSAPLNPDYSVVNEWWATTNSEKIRVFAGGIWDDPLIKDRSQGFVSVMYQSPDYSRFTRPLVTVNTPSPTGALKIIDATGMKLKLQSEQGSIYYFDVESAKFVP